MEKGESEGKEVSQIDAPNACLTGMSEAMNEIISPGERTFSDSRVDRVMLEAVKRDRDRELGVAG